MLIINYLLRWYQEKALYFPCTYLVLVYMCVTKSVSYTMSVRNYFYGSITSLKYLFQYPVLSFLEICPYIIPETYSTPIYYTNKNGEHAIIFNVTLSLRPIKKQRNPVTRENTKTWRQFPFQLCVETNAAQIMCC